MQLQQMTVTLHIAFAGGECRQEQQHGCRQHDRLPAGRLAVLRAQTCRRLHKSDVPICGLPQACQAHGKPAGPGDASANVVL